jgi:hypothetical protein
MNIADELLARLNHQPPVRDIRPGSVLLYVSQGANFRQIKGISLLPMKEDKGK